jgi:hypothetical protein
VQYSRADAVVDSLLRYGYVLGAHPCQTGAPIIVGQRIETWPVAVYLQPEVAEADGEQHADEEDGGQDQD